VSMARTLDLSNPRPWEWAITDIQRFAELRAAAAALGEGAADVAREAATAERLRTASAGRVG
jgi:hypothetical protein